MPDEHTDTESALTEGAIRFNYIKSPFFRVVHVDGAIGGITPRGYIHAALYSERRAIPQITEQPVLSDGKLGAAKILKGKEHVARELEADLMLDARTARELADWLVKKADDLDKLAQKEGDA